MDALEIRELRESPRTIVALQHILEGAPEYHYRTTGRLADPEGARKLFDFLPGDRTFADKFVFAFYHEGRLIGFADLIRNHPHPGTAFVHELLFGELAQHRGFGTQAVRLLLERIREWSGIRTVRIELPRTNHRVVKFLERAGFQPTGEVVAYKSGRVECPADVFERAP